jgi:hypothetical protein
VNCGWFYGCENSGELTFYTKNLYSLNVEFEGKTHRKYLYGLLCFGMILQLQIFQQKDGNFAKQARKKESIYCMIV